MPISRTISLSPRNPRSKTKPSPSGGDAGHEDEADVLGTEVKQLAEGAGDAATHLNGGSLAAGGAAEEMGDDGAEEDGGGHACRDAAAGFVDLIDNEVVSGLDFFAHGEVEGGDEDAAEGQEGEEPGEAVEGEGGPADFGGFVEAPEKEGDGDGDADDEPDGDADEEPAGEEPDLREPGHAHVSEGAGRAAHLERRWAHG